MQGRCKPGKFHTLHVRCWQVRIEHAGWSLELARMGTTLSSHDEGLVVQNPAEASLAYPKARRSEGRPIHWPGIARSLQFAGRSLMLGREVLMVGWSGWCNLASQAWHLGVALIMMGHKPRN